MQLTKVEWVFPWAGIFSELAASHIPPQALSACTNMYYLTPNILRSRGGFDTFCTAGSAPVKHMYFWDYDDKLYVANDNAQLYKCSSGSAVAVTGPAQNVTDMVSFGVGATPKLIVAEAKGAQDHTLHTYDGSTYAELTGTSVPACEKVMARYGRLFGTCDASQPSRIYFSDVGDETVWSGAWGEGGWFDVGPSQDGDILDWLEFQGALYVFKERAIYRVTGDLPNTFVPKRLKSSDKIVVGSIADCARGILYATAYGVFPLDYKGLEE